MSRNKRLWTGTEAMPRNKKLWTGTEAMPSKKRLCTGMRATALCLTMVWFLTGCVSSKQSQTLLPEELMSPEEVNYKTTQVETGAFTKTASGKAGVIYPLQATLVWEKDNAHFKEVLVSRGQQVKEGEALIIFDIEESRAKLESLRLQMLRTREDFAVESTQRMTEINAEKKMAEELRDYDLQLAKLSLEKLQAGYEECVYFFEREISRLEESIAAIEEEIEENTLRAPFAGEIQYVIDCNEGDKVISGETLITMYSTEKFLLSAENAKGNLRYHMDVVIQAGRNDNTKIFGGKVIVAPNVLPPAVSQDVTLIALDENVTENDLTNYIMYQCNTQELQNIPLIPRRAVNAESGKEFVYVLDQDTVRKRYIMTGSYNTDVVCVLDGLTEGQIILVD